MPEHHTLQHSNLGAIRGLVVSEKTIQYRNLPYAKISKRWTQAEVRNDLPRSSDSVYDATSHGPLAPQPEGTINFDFGLIQKTLPVEHEEVIAHEGCLNLVVNAPIKPSGRVSVMVFVHGGGLFLGANSWPQYDLGRLADYAAELQKPIVTVGINYRLGLLGFLSSVELENNSVPGNYGLLDQVCALQWIKSHIADFGGDPENITLFGESAGAISVSLQLQRGEPLFNRAICMSGQAALRSPIPQEDQEKFYQQVVEKLGLQHHSAAERAKRLRSLPLAELLKLPENRLICPTINHGYPSVTLETLSKSSYGESELSWCKALMIGDCAADGYVYTPLFSRPRWPEPLLRCLRAQFDREETDEILQAYTIDLTQPSGVSHGLMSFVNDCRFYVPLFSLAEGWAQKNSLFIYHLEEGNPFDGPFKGLATHVLDIALILQNYNRYLEPETATLARSMSEAFINFATGDDKFYRQSAASAGGPSSDLVMVWGGSQKGTKFTSAKRFDKEERHGRAEIIMRLGVDKCTRVLDMLQSSPF